MMMPLRQTFSASSQWPCPRMKSRPRRPRQRRPLMRRRLPKVLRLHDVHVEYGNIIRVHVHVHDNRGNRCDSHSGRRYDCHFPWRWMPQRGKQLAPEEAITNLTPMGSPEADVRHCLRVAHGDPAFAVEFLTQGIPDNIVAAADLVRASYAAIAGCCLLLPQRPPRGPSPLQPVSCKCLRHHPQFKWDAASGVNQSGSVPNKFSRKIGQQQPDLRAKNRCQPVSLFRIMNEPITEQDATAAAASDAASAFNMPPGGATGCDNYPNRRGYIALVSMTGFLSNRVYVLSLSLHFFSPWS
jgi:hypothetical protein